ncbi:hypothetical protein FJZ31_15320 [Candidatus Poribacteria bacterium]|nr:hypothetical protein [Candidatus Poribacteria bacterium]
MNEEQRFIKYLENIKPPEVESPNHRQILRRELLNEIERRQKMASRKRKLKIIYVVAALVCLSALAFAGVTYIRKWHFVGEKDGKYTFRTEPKEICTGVIQSNFASIDAESKEQAEKKLQQIDKDTVEIEKLCAEGKRELLEVIEQKTDTGEPFKIYRYKYILSDGREVIRAESTDKTPAEMKADAQNRLEQKQKEREEKVRLARQEGKREEITKVGELELDGKVITTYLVVKYKMPDGSEVEVGEGDALAEKLRSALGQEEFDRLTKDIMEKKGESLGTEEREIEGRKFIFSRSKFKLSDGREVIYSEGEPSN